MKTPQQPRGALTAVAAIVALLLTSQLVSADFISTWRQRWKPYTLPRGFTRSPPAWTPKTDAAAYANRVLLADWAGVVSACRTVINAEKRIGSFLLRTVAHDALTINLTACAAGNTAACGGADSSIILTTEELTRGENVYDSFADIAKRSVIKIATFFDISATDTLALCGAAAIEELSGGRNKVIGPKWAKNFRVGRVDSVTAAPAGQLLGGAATAFQQASWWASKGFTIDEGIALMGTHALIDEQACLVGINGHADYCDPTTSTCQNVRMFNLSNHFYKDACSPTITIMPTPPMEFADDLVTEMPDVEFEAVKRAESCKFSSPEFKELAVLQAAQERAGMIRVKPETDDGVIVTWSNFGCRGAPSCPHATRWHYTTSDAYLARICQGTAPPGPEVAPIQAAMKKYLNQAAWDSALASAYLKMVNQNVRWARATRLINGRECSVPYAVNRTCAAAKGMPNLVATLACLTCSAGISSTCNDCCRCPYTFQRNGRGGYVLRSGSAVLPADPPPPPAPPLPPTATADPPTDVEPVRTPIPDVNTNPGSQLPDVPPSPYRDSLPNDACSGVVVDVRGFPSSPFAYTPFQKAFKNPDRGQKLFTTCKTLAGGACADPENPGPTEAAIDVYNINVVETDINLDLPCSAPTRVLAYNGTVPGPTIITPMGRQTLVRFNNQIPADSKAYPEHEPCVTSSRRGRPLSIHLHGAASLAPYDGWAEDSTCSGESKDYLYPNNRPNTGWYHDHQVDITGENAHAGMAGFYLVKNSTDVGAGPDRWGLDGIPEHHLMLADKVFNSACQFRFEPWSVHRNAHFGDVNLVSGIPFPVLAVTPSWQRFRTLNAAVSRPWLLSLVDSSGSDVSSKVCHMIASDGGYRRAPVAFPDYPGLFMGVAERYEFVCDFSSLAGQTLYLWNTKDEDRMKDVPFFCNSHLVMKVVVGTLQACAAATDCGAKFETSGPAIPTTLDAGMSESERSDIVSRVQAGQCDRKFVFGRGGGQWVINGETWVTARVAARDVPVNSREIWCLETKGGWFHPIHIHLIDMYVMARARSGSYQRLEGFESDVPKDVVSLHPGAEVAIVARWGAHRGEYMFHCHNLRHEDNEMMRSLRTDTPHTSARPQSPSFAQISQMTFAGPLGTLYDSYKNPRLPAASAVPTASIAALDPALARKYLDMELYRIFYPGQNEREQLCNRSLNPWYVRGC